MAGTAPQTRTAETAPQDGSHPPEGARARTLPHVSSADPAVTRHGASGARTGLAAADSGEAASSEETRGPISSVMDTNGPGIERISAILVSGEECRAIDDVDALRAQLVEERANTRDQRSRADRLERENRLLMDMVRRPESPDDPMGWGWRTGDLDVVVGPVATREDAIEAATQHLEILYAEVTSVPEGSRERTVIYVGRCLPWQPQALDPAGVLGAMDAEAMGQAHLYAQVAPFEWTPRQVEDLGVRLRTALRDWMDALDRTPFWTLEPRAERVEVEVVVPARAPLRIPPRVVAVHELAVSDGSRS